MLRRIARQPSIANNSLRANSFRRYTTPNGAVKSSPNWMLIGAGVLGAAGLYMWSTSKSTVHGKTHEDKGAPEDKNAPAKNRVDMNDKSQRMEKEKHIAKAQNVDK